MSFYAVINLFEDELDGNRLYKVGDLYPRAGLVPTVERIKELMGKNKYGKIFIQKYTVGTGEAGAPKPINLERDMAIARNVHDTVDDRILHDMTNMRNWFDGTIASKDEVDRVTAQLAHKIGGGVKLNPEDMSPETLALVTGEGTINLETIPQDKSIVWDKFDDGLRENIEPLLKNMFNNSNVATPFTAAVGNRLHTRPDGSFANFGGYNESWQAISFVAGHKYYTKLDLSADSEGRVRSDGVEIVYEDSSIDSTLFISTSDLKVSGLITASKSLKGNMTFRIGVSGLIKRKNQLLVDLTEAFGAGNEPTFEEFEGILKVYPDNWFDTHADAKYTERYLMNAQIANENKYLDLENTLNKSKALLTNMFKRSDAAATLEANLGDRLQIGLTGTLNRLGSFTTAYQNFNIVEDHKYYAKFEVASGSVGRVNEIVEIIYEDGAIDSKGVSSQGYKSSQVIKATKTGRANVTFRVSRNGLIKRKNQLLVDLTEAFGAGNEPTFEEFEGILKVYPDNWFDTQAEAKYAERYLMNATGVVSKIAMMPSADLNIFYRDKNIFVLWYDTERKIVYGRDNSLPILEQTTLYASYDSGSSWRAVYNSTGVIRAFKTLANGHHIANLNTGRIRRISPNFSGGEGDFFGFIASGPISAALGIAEHNGVIMYAEYSETSQCAILKSTDGGITWYVSRSGEDVRHWHSVQVDPYTGHWWACSGDTNAQSKIIKSEDDGETWVTMSEGAQDYRAVGLAFTPTDVIWGMDSIALKPYIYRSDKNNWNPIKIGETPFDGTTLGITTTLDGFVVGYTRVEVNSAQKDVAIIWATDGDSIKVLQKFYIKPELRDGISQPGFSTATHADENNVWFINAKGTVFDGGLGVTLPLSIF